MFLTEETKTRIQMCKKKKQTNFLFKRTDLNLKFSRTSGSSVVIHEEAQKKDPSEAGH